MPNTLTDEQKTKAGKLSAAQARMLCDFERDSEATDLADFDAGRTLAWTNRERVIDALRRKGLLDDNGITDSGRAAVAHAHGGTCPAR